MSPSKVPLSKWPTFRPLLHSSFLLVFFFWAGSALKAQETAPVLEWQEIDAPPEKPSGYSFAFDQWLGTSAIASYAVTAAPAAQPQTNDESGKDWWNFHCNLTDGGYVAVGYTSYVNWTPDNGCGLPIVEYDTSNPDDLLDYFRGERFDRRNSQIRQVIARYGADGTVVWYKTFAAGTLDHVIQDHSDNIVVTGYSFDVRASARLLG